MAGSGQEFPAFPFDRPNIGAPAEYAKLREEGPLRRVRLWDGKLAWLATRYDDVRALLADNRFSADPRRAGYPHITPAREREKREELPFFVMMDPPEHTRFRRMLIKEFTFDKINAMRPDVESIIHNLIDDMEAKGAPADLVKQFALPIPSIIIANMLGVPHSDHEFFQDRTVTLLSIDGEPGAATRAGDDLRDYMKALVHEKVKSPEKHNDILGRLAAERVAVGELSEDEAAMLGAILVLAGHETTANMIALTVLSLLQNAEVFAAVKANATGEEVRRAVEEMLRFHSIVHFTGARVAREDVSYGDVTIRAGEGLLAQILAGNHDPRRFEEPEAVKISRPELAPHIAFGFGIHQCLGQPLARLELNVVLSVLPQRMPNLRLGAPAESLPFKRNHFVHGLQALPVVW